MKFQSDRSGLISAVRFYKATTNTGSHVGHLWAADGTLLATVPFTAETASGWQQACLDTPVAVTANTTYVVSYHAPVGRYSFDANYFATQLTNAPLRAQDTTTAGGNGVYRYGAGNLFPNQTFNAGNYWVDVVFVDSVWAPTVTSTTPVNAATGVSQTTAVTAVFSEGMDPASITSTTFELRDAAAALVPATVSYNAANRTATLQPSASLNAPATSRHGCSAAPRARESPTRTARRWRPPWWSRSRPHCRWSRPTRQSPRRRRQRRRAPARASRSPRHPRRARRSSARSTAPLSRRAPARRPTRPSRLATTRSTSARSTPAGT